MFGSTPKNDPPPPAAPSTPSPARVERSVDTPARPRAGGILSSGVTINGNVKFGTDLVIDGEIKGNVTSTGTLTVGQNARIIGNITVGSVTVNGTVQGNVTASERCTLGAGATLRGDVVSPRLAVDENATFLGSAQITAKPAS
jgi:cytoskeletal protein CcmA (bactofilin family)